MVKIVEKTRKSMLGLLLAAGVGLALFSTASAEEPLLNRSGWQVEPVAYNNFSYLYLSDDEGEGKNEDEKEKTIEERLKDLEENHSDLKEAHGKLKESYVDLKKGLKGYSKSGHSGSKVKVSGRIHTDHWAFPSTSDGIDALESFDSDNPTDPLYSPQDRIGFRRMRFGVKGDLWKTMTYKIEMEFAGGNKSEFRDAYFGWKDVPFFQQVLIGNQKRPYGLDHLNSSRYNVFMERPFVIEAFNQDARRWGIQSYNVSKDLAWNWRYGIFNQHLMQGDGNHISDHYQMEFASRIANTIWYDESSGGRGYAHWGVSSTFANPDSSGLPGRAPNEARFRHRPEARSTNRWLNTGRISGADDYQLLGTEALLNLGSLQLVGEYQNLWLQRNNGANDVHLHGGYFSVSYFLTGEHMAWDRKSGTLGRVKPLENFFLVNTCCDGVKGGWGAWQLAYRYSYADLNDQDILGGVGRSHTFGVNWLWNQYARMQFNCIVGEIDDTNPIAHPSGTFTGGNYTILGTRLMVDF